MRLLPGLDEGCENLQAISFGRAFSGAPQTLNFEEGCFVAAVALDWFQLHIPYVDRIILLKR
jgi:hypothetical protein